MPSHTFFLKLVQEAGQSENTTSCREQLANRCSFSELVLLQSGEPVGTRGRG